MSAKGQARLGMEGKEKKGKWERERADWLFFSRKKKNKSRDDLSK